MPKGGWPVTIFGHGATSSKDTPNSWSVISTMAAHGIAVVAINIPGNGFGPLGTLTVAQGMGDPVTFPAGGRGIDQNGDHRDLHSFPTRRSSDLVPGNGFGPLGTLTVNQTMADPVTFSAGGRGIDQDRDHIISINEGQFAIDRKSTRLNSSHT